MATTLITGGTVVSATGRAPADVLVDGEKFAIATAKDTEAGRYRGLIVPPAHNTAIQVTDSRMIASSRPNP